MEIYYKNGSISPADVVKFLGFNGQWRPVCFEIIRNREVMKKAKELGIAITDDELQGFADSYRIARGLRTTGDMLAFLQQAGMTEDDFEFFCETSVLAEKVKARLADAKRIEEHFVNFRAEYDLARISVIFVQDESLAREIVVQTTEEDEDFHKLARKHSVDATTKYAGGYAGVLSRGMLPAEVSAKVFTANSGEVIGPFKTGGLFHLILVEEVMKADLNDSTKGLIRERIFGEWMSQFLSDNITIVQ